MISLSMATLLYVKPQQGQMANAVVWSTHRQLLANVIQIDGTSTDIVTPEAKKKNRLLLVTWLVTWPDIQPGPLQDGMTFL